MDTSTSSEESRPTVVGIELRIDVVLVQLIHELKY